MAGLRIGVDARPLGTPATGIGRYLSALLAHLSRTDHEFILYSDRELASVTDFTVRNGQTSGALRSTLFAQTRFPVWAHKDRLDLFWSPRHHLPLLLSPTTPSVVTIHDLVWKRLPQSMAPFGALAERLLMPPSIHRSAAIIAPSRATAGDIATFFPSAASKIHIVPLASSLAAIQPRGTSARTPFMLCVGTLEPRKNFTRVVEAFEKSVLTGDYPHELLIAGNEGWKNEELLQRVRAAGPRVRLLGRVDDSDLASLYAAADFVLAPSLYEGFCLPILEAMSFGKPVITSNTSSMPEVAGDAALLVDPTSTQAIADAMETLLRDRSLHRELSQRALAVAGRYSWERCAEETLAVLEAAAAARH